MKSVRNNENCAEWCARAALLAALASGLQVAGCGMPGAPLPPSLNLPQPVADLRAVRTGDEVSLAWTMPRRNTDKMLLKEAVRVKVCRSEGKAGQCAQAGELKLMPGAPGTFSEALPAAEESGRPRSLSYFLEVENAQGRTAGPSNLAAVVAGQAPPPVTGLKATVGKSGVTLRWTGIPGESSAVRLERRLLTPPVAAPKDGLLKPAVEPAVQRFLVADRAAEGRALDKTIRFGATYEFRAQRVARVTLGGEMLELVGGLSEPVRVEARDVFPPDAPTGLAAVATTPDNGAAIDLNWQPNTEADLAGYVVYRCEGEGAWQRISPQKPLAAPAYHDASVQAGHSYRYAVTAVDEGNHESPRSAEAEETVPAP